MVIIKAIIHDIQMNLFPGLSLHPMLILTMTSGILSFIFVMILPFFGKRFIKPLMLVYLVLVITLTLFREQSAARQINLTPFWSYARWHAADVRWQVYMNVFLFIPLGGLLRSSDIRHPILFSLAVSVIIEASQYAFALGMCETDDVIHNTIGAMIGCLLYQAVCAVRKLLLPHKEDE